MTIPMPGEVDDVGAAIDRIVGGNAYELVGAYYDPSPRNYSGMRNVLFAGRLFDELPGNDPKVFTDGDLVAASLLDVRFGPHAVMELLQRDECNRLLADVPDGVALWEARPEQLDRDSAAWQLWRRLVAIPGVNRTRASKLLARKRPHLMPILDSIVVARLQLSRGNRWETLRMAITPERRSRIEHLGHAAMHHGASHPSALRLLDVATWMTFSQSRQATAVRNSLSMDE